MTNAVANVNNEGDVLQIYFVGAEHDIEAGRKSDNMTVVFIEDDVGMNIGTFAELHYYDFPSGTWKTRTEKPGTYYTWQDASWKFEPAGFAALIRQQRNELLKETDWLQLPDAPITNEKKAEWATYRQALRDVPANSVSKTHANDVVWPTPPTDSEGGETDGPD